MASPREIFSTFGPPHIRPFDWNNMYHRTSSLSCLVKGVYTMERDRQQEQFGLNSPAKDWWECVGFTLDKPLIDKSDNSIYGAIFKNSYINQSTPNSAIHPRYVIAFRGTILMPQTLTCDVKHNIRFAFENLNRGDRFAQVIHEIQNCVTRHGNTAVWIAGHSLGAGLALLAGKTMAMSGYPVEAYIFNPPISLAPLEQIFESEKFKCTVRLARDVVKAGVAKVFGHKVREGRPYMNLASWTPKLYVNQSDPICSEYIGHFEHKIKMSGIGAGKIESLASSYSVRGKLFGRGGESSSSYSPMGHLHFLPSAILMVNKTVSPNFQTDHGIHQWWNPTLEHNSVLYQFNS